MSVYLIYALMCIFVCRAGVRVRVRDHMRVSVRVRAWKVWCKVHIYLEHTAG